jgi:hypothetical protein
VIFIFSLLPPDQNHSIVTKGQGLQIITPGCKVQRSHTLRVAWMASAFNRRSFEFFKCLSKKVSAPVILAKIMIGNKNFDGTLFTL